MRFGTTAATERISSGGSRAGSLLKIEPVQLPPLSCSFLFFLLPRTTIADGSRPSNDSYDYQCRVKIFSSKTDNDRILELTVINLSVVVKASVLLTKLTLLQNRS